MRGLVLPLLLAIALERVAVADVARGDESPRGWQAGVNLRTDLGTHRVRAGLGARVRSLTLGVVLDPKVFVDMRQNDTDVLAEWWLRPGGWAALAGWRVAQISIDRGRNFHHQLVLGATAGMPSLADRQIRGRFGFALETTVVRHGSGIETDVLSLETERHWRDLVSLSLFVRFEYAGAL